MKKKVAINKVLTIVSQLPPQVNGVGDYAFFLAQQLRKDFSIETLFIRTDSSYEKNKYFQFEADFVLQKSKIGLLKKIEDHNVDVLILHYVGYAYSKRGCPFWLVEGLEAWKKNKPGRRIITIFHELYASGKIYESAFWLHFFQKNLISRILKISECSIANTEVTFNLLRSALPSKEILLKPVFSNVGELKILPVFDKRENDLVIFGSKDKRAELFDHSLSSLIKWCIKLNIKKIIEIGPLRENVEEIKEIQIIQLGLLKSVDVSKYLERSKYGILSYPVPLLGKSGIYAAYAAHGVIPIVIDKIHCENLNSNIYFLNESENDNLNEMSTKVFNWYNNHNLENHSLIINEVLKKIERS